MEIKQIVSLEVKKDNHTFSFTIPQGSTWGMALDSAFEIIDEINKLSQQAIQKAKTQGVQNELE